MKAYLTESTAVRNLPHLSVTIKCNETKNRKHMYKQWVSSYIM